MGKVILSFLCVSFFIYFFLGGRLNLCHLGCTLLVEQIRRTIEINMGSIMFFSRAGKEGGSCSLYQDWQVKGTISFNPRILAGIQIAHGFNFQH